MYVAQTLLDLNAATPSQLLVCAYVVYSQRLTHFGVVTTKSDERFGSLGGYRYWTYHWRKRFFIDVSA